MNEILTYDDLLKEKRRLETALAVQKKQIMTDFDELREELRPALQVLSFMGKITKRSLKNPLISMGTTIAGELLMKSSPLSAGTRISRLLAVMAAEKISTWLRNRGKSSFMDKLMGLLKGAQ